MVEVKICGLRDAAMVEVALAAGADFIGFVFVPSSPRFIDIAAARPLITRVQAAGAQAVGLWQATGALPLSDVLSSGVHILQAHGVEPAGVALPANLPIWRACGVSQAEDLPQKPLPCARLLLDAKPPVNAAYAGGHGAAFDWMALRGWAAPQPWVLAGGLTPRNVAAAIATSRATAVDVSSGVERRRGEKDESLIRAFIAAAKAAST